MHQEMSRKNTNICPESSPLVPFYHSENLVQLVFDLIIPGKSERQETFDINFSWTQSVHAQRNFLGTIL